jgi:hypothetical protein
VYAHDGARARTRRDVGGFGYLLTGIKIYPGNVSKWSRRGKL